MKVRKFVSWAILVAMQSAAVVVSIPLGVFLSEKFYLLPQWLLTTLYVTLGPRDLLPLTLHFAVSAFLIFGISTAFLKSRTLRDGLGAVVSFYCLGATLALGAWSVFLGAQVRIVPEILFGTGLAATAMFLVLIFSVQAVAYGTAALPRRIANFFILLFRMPVRRHALLLLIVFSLSPIVAARVFKENRSFADFLTATVMQFRAEGGSAHVLREAFPGVTFQQPVDLMPTLRSNAQQFGFLFGRQDYPLRRNTCPQDLDLGLEQPHLRVVPGHEKLCQEDDKEGERLIHLARLHHGAKKNGAISA